MKQNNNVYVKKAKDYSYHELIELSDNLRYINLILAVNFKKDIDNYFHDQIQFIVPTTGNTYD